MSEESRLANVKHSASLILNFLGPSDRLSVITFGDESEILCSAVACTSQQKKVIQTVIDMIVVNGCTNLSAAILNVKTVATAATTLKTGVLLLTDGHANRGTCTSEAILDMFNTVHTQNPELSFTVVGYGTMHNAPLMKSIAENTQGAYCIVENLEAAASVVGNSIGGLFSCSAQLLQAKCPDGTKIHWAHKVVNNTIKVGDIYDESDKILLFDLPVNALTQPIVLTGTTVPALEPFSIEVVAKPWSATPIDIEFFTAVELTTLSYKCSSLFTELTNTESSNLTRITSDIAEFRIAIFAEKYNGNPVADMLRSECKSLETALAGICRSATPDMISRIHQHAAFTSLGRGISQPISLTQAEDNPSHPAEAVMSPATSRIQRRVTNLMATMSSGGGANDYAQARQMSMEPST
jgi:hypothetical protein